MPSEIATESEENDIAVEEDVRMGDADADEEMEEMVDWAFEPEMENTISNEEDEDYQSI